MRFQRGYADFRERSRHALDVVSHVPGLRNLLPLVHQASRHPCPLTPRELPHPLPLPVVTRGLTARCWGHEQGFWSAYTALRAELQQQVTASIIKAGPQARLYLTGHSLGGSLATLAAYVPRVAL